jgi:long-chain acyl-CoA synthetase
VPLSSFASLDCFESNYVLMPNPHDIADILFTTGTTGAPKGVPLTYANEFAAAVQINTYIQNRQEDIELLALPVSHSFGLGRLRCCLMKGQTIILLGSFANVKKIFRTIEEEHVSGFTMVPASWKYLQKMVGDKLSLFAGQLKYIEMGSAFFSEDDKRHLASLFPRTRVTMHYGLTEASRSAFMEFHEDKDNLSSVGKSSPGVDIGIFDAEGIRQPPGHEGEICVKGEHVMRGYLWQDNDNMFFGNYFRTGDCGVMTDDGYIYLKSRIKELINVGGKKVAPAEVDEQILKIPGVIDCACVGVSDPEGVLGEVVKGCVVKDPTSDITFDEIVTALVGKLESYKIPVVWQWIDAVPKTHNGKVQRNLLK